MASVVGLKRLRLRLRGWGTWYEHEVNVQSQSEARNSIEERQSVYQTFDSGAFDWLIVTVAGIGFLTDAYAIFALNTVVPMLETVYPNIASHSKKGITVSTLFGSVIGQVTFGVLADVYGRKVMYGLELIITIGATLGMSMSSNGYMGSMSIVGWLVFWRITVGIGIGADYPLSAVITSEFAARERRAQMIAAVFFTQSIGQLLATVVALIATARITGCEGVQLEQSTKNNDECLRAVDRTWRFIVGFGAVPALFAIASRLTIPESPRFTLDVIKNPTVAKSDAKKYGEQLQQSSSTSVSSIGGYLNGVTQRAQILEMGEWNGAESLRTEHLKGVQQSATEPKTTKLSAIGDIKDYFITKGNYRNLAGTMLSWFFLDFAFFGLGINNSNTLATIWSYRKDHEVDLDMINVFMGNGIHLLVLVSVGSVIGGATTIALIEKIGPKKLQICGFAILSCLLVIIGASYKALIRDGQRAVLIPLYIICHIFFNFGPNTTTFIIPAEIFPTRFRCSCHGISAACGKLGSIFAQVLIYYIPFNHEKLDWGVHEGDGLPKEGTANGLGWVLLIFAFFMFLGVLATLLIDETRGKTGEAQSLEEIQGEYWGEVGLMNGAFMNGRRGSE